LTKNVDGILLAFGDSSCQKQKEKNNLGTVLSRGQAKTLPKLSKNISRDGKNSFRL
jgi:hypothetical protein